MVFVGGTEERGLHPFSLAYGLTQFNSRQKKFSVIRFFASKPSSRTKIKTFQQKSRKMIFLLCLVKRDRVRDRVMDRVRDRVRDIIPC